MAVPFTEYVSLGCNCESAFQVRRILGRDSSSAFSWNVTSIPALISLLSTRFEGVLYEDNLSPHEDGSLIRDSSHGYLFHSPFDRKDFRNDPEFVARLIDTRSKFNYLIEKLYRPRGPDDRTAYFYKAIEHESTDVVRNGMLTVRDLLNEIHGDSDFVLVVLQLKEREEAPWGEYRIHNRYLSRYAPWHDATDGHVSSWDKIFGEFPHRDELRFAGF